MTGSLVSVWVLAVVDSINPSALAVTLSLLARGSRPGAILAYVAGIFVTYLVAGVLLMLGVGALWGPLERALESRTANVVAAVAGAGMLLYAFTARRPDGADDATEAHEGARGLLGLFALGVTVTGLEVPTALPYFAAAGILAGEGLGVTAWFPVLLVYNVIFVLPPLLLALGYRFLSERASARFVGRLRREARETMVWIIGIVGFFLLFDSLSSLNLLNVR